VRDLYSKPCTWYNIETAEISGNVVIHVNEGVTDLTTVQSTDTDGNKIVYVPRALTAGGGVGIVGDYDSTASAPYGLRMNGVQYKTCELSHDAKLLVVGNQAFAEYETSGDVYSSRSVSLFNLYNNSVSFIKTRIGTSEGESGVLAGAYIRETAFSKDDTFLITISDTDECNAYWIDLGSRYLSPIGVNADDLESSRITDICFVGDDLVAFGAFRHGVSTVDAVMLVYEYDKSGLISGKVGEAILSTAASFLSTDRVFVSSDDNGNFIASALGKANTNIVKMTTVTRAETTTINTVALSGLSASITISDIKIVPDGTHLAVAGSVTQYFKMFLNTAGTFSLLASTYSNVALYPIFKLSVAKLPGMRIGAAYGANGGKLFSLSGSTLTELTIPSLSTINDFAFEPGGEIAAAATNAGVFVYTVTDIYQWENGDTLKAVYKNLSEVDVIDTFTVSDETFDIENPVVDIASISTTNTVKTIDKSDIAIDYPEAEHARLYSLIGPNSRSQASVYFPKDSQAAYNGDVITLTSVHDSTIKESGVIFDEDENRIVATDVVSGRAHKKYVYIEFNIKLLEGITEDESKKSAIRAAVSDYINAITFSENIRLSDMIRSVSQDDLVADILDYICLPVPTFYMSDTSSAIVAGTIQSSTVLSLGKNEHPVLQECLINFVQSPPVF